MESLSNQGKPVAAQRTSKASPKTLRDICNLISEQVCPDDYYFYLYDGADQHHRYWKRWSDCSKGQRRRRMGHYHDYEESSAVQRLEWYSHPKASPREVLKTLKEATGQAQRDSENQLLRAVEICDLVNEASHTLELAIREGGIFKHGIFVPPMHIERTRSISGEYVQGKRALTHQLDKSFEEFQATQENILNKARKLIAHLHQVEDDLERLIPSLWESHPCQTPLPESVLRRMQRLQLRKDYPCFIDEATIQTLQSSVKGLDLPKDTFTLNESALARLSPSELHAKTDAFFFLSTLKELHTLSLALQKSFGSEARVPISQAMSLETAYELGYAWRCEEQLYWNSDRYVPACKLVECTKAELSALRQSLGFDKGGHTNKIYFEKLNKAATGLTQQTNLGQKQPEIGS